MNERQQREAEDYAVAYQLQVQETLDATKRRSGSSGGGNNQERRAEQEAIEIDGGSQASIKLCFAGRSGGHGAVIFLPNGEVLWSSGQQMGGATHNEAAYEGLLAGLRACRDLGIDHIIAECDSELLVREVNGESAVTEVNAKLKNEVDRVVTQMTSFKLRFIDRRHNAVADELAHNAVTRQGREKRRRMSDDVTEVVVVHEEEVVEPCGICLEDVIIKQIHELGACLHRFCKSCLDKLITQHANERRFPVACPAPRCCSSIPTAECAQLASSRPALVTLETLEIETSIPASQRFYCPHSSCSALMTRPEELTESENGAAECLECHRMVCMRCTVAWHAGLSCVEYQALPPHLKSAEDRQLAQLAEDKGWRRCGRCDRVIELSSGCRHMKCVCGNEFCYKCGTEWAGHKEQCACALFDVPEDTDPPPAPRSIPLPRTDARGVGGAGRAGGGQFKRRLCRFWQRGFASI